MQERHKNRKQYFEEQGITTKKYVIPYIEEILPVNDRIRVLEIGCGEGGNLAPFIEIGCEVVGNDLNCPQIEKARDYIREFHPEANVKLICEDIYKVDPNDLGTFDLIVMRDVIEHIFDQERFLKFVKTFLKPGGRIFFGFPPWYMPFGGHQQICKNKLLSKLPYYHLLPRFLYKAILKAFGEAEGTIRELLEIKETGISTQRFARIVHKEGYVTEKKTYYFINPNYEIKFGLKPRILSPILKPIPFFRDFVTTCCYCIIRKD